MEKNVKKVEKILPKKLIDGLSRDDWSLTLREMRSALNNLKIQRLALEGSIRQVEEMVDLYDSLEE